MFITWDDAKEKYPGKWVILRNPQYSDIFHTELVGGHFVAIANDQSDMYNSIPDEDDGNVYSIRHTWEEHAVGLLKSGY